MRNNKLTLYYIAKYTNYELLVDELILTKSTNQSDSLEKIKRRKKSIQFKIFRMKILYAIIFGILPIAPLLGYFEIADYLINTLLSVEVIIFHGSLFIGLFFTLQFFNFFLMGMLETGMIMTGRIFEWLETLPLPRDKLKKIVLITLFRSFDIPIIVIIMAFPIVMLIGTANILIFFISIGISLLNVFFSFSLLIIIGGRINRVLDINEINSRRSYTIRVFNIISYIIIILGSMYLIQYAITSIDLFFRLFLNIRSPSLTNTILSIIPYPFNPSYFVLAFMIPSRVPLNLWLSTILGLVIFAGITWWIYSKALNQLEKLTFSKFRSTKEGFALKKPKKEVKVKIKRTSPFTAHLKKDLVLITHDLKTFMTVITSIILSFLFTYYYITGTMASTIYVENLIYINWVGLLLISPVISGMLIFSFLSLEDSGQSILISLPIVPRDQAKAKFFLIFIIQTIATILPNLMYIESEYFRDLFLSTLGALPLVWTLLLLLFEMKISYFGKKKYQYVIEEVKPNNRMFKWVMIMSLQYILSFWLISFTFIILAYIDFTMMTTFWTLASIIGLNVAIIIFYRMFPKYRRYRELQFIQEQPIVDKIVSKPEIELLYYPYNRGREHLRFRSIKKQNFLPNHPWIAIILVLCLYFCFIEIDSFSLITFYPSFWYSFTFTSVIGLIKSNLILGSLCIILIPYVLGLPNGKQSMRGYLDAIGLGWIIKFSKVLIWCLVSVLFLVIFDLVISTITSLPSITYFVAFSEIMQFLTFVSYYFWQSILFRGIILNILINKYLNTTFDRAANLKAVFVNNIIYLLWFIFIIIPYSFYWHPSTSQFAPGGFILISAFIFFFGLIFAYIFIRTRNLLPEIVLNMLLYLVGFSSLFAIPYITYI
ncbi:MAG: hypothetical protein ACFE8N_06635 [Promethearchaeota archaeon]